MTYELKPKEYEIMKFIWIHAQSGVTFREIHNYINSIGKQHSRQRVNCYIQSLINKQFLIASGEDRHKIYTPKLTKEDFDNQIANKVLNHLYDGSLKNFILALNGNDKISKETADELRKILNDKDK